MAEDRKTGTAEKAEGTPVSPSVRLTDGLTLGDKGPQREAELRTLTAGEILDASQEGEIAIKTAEGYQMVSSPALTGMAVLRRQIARLGEIKGPLSLDMLRRLTQVDLQLLQAKADELDQAEGQRLARELVERGRGGGAAPGAG